jgi:hypothetical protein
VTHQPVDAVYFIEGVVDDPGQSVRIGTIDLDGVFARHGDAAGLVMGKLRVPDGRRLRYQRGGEPKANESRRAALRCHVTEARPGSSDPPDSSH